MGILSTNENDSILQQQNLTITDKVDIILKLIRHGGKQDALM